MSRPSSTASSAGRKQRAAKKKGAASRGRAKARSAGGTLLHLDAFSGAAGNMFLGALLDLGLNRRRLEADLGLLGVAYELKVEAVRRGVLAARYVDVVEPAPRGAKNAKKKTASNHHRSFTSIRDLIAKTRLEASVKERAIAIFQALGEAEAKIHGVAIEEVHFHEVGAVDAIVDITGAAIALHHLGVERITCSPVGLGHGSVDTEHGRLPLPAPATLELLRGIPTVPVPVEWETVTPTGAAILRTVVDEFGQLPAMEIERTGYGAGNEREGPMPNVLRAVLGRGCGASRDRVAVIECNLDDLNPEHFDYLMERLLDAGALDVSVQHVQSKKNRPGFLIRVLAQPDRRTPLAEILFRESTTLGVRTSEWDRLLLQRELHRVETRYGRIRVKVVRRLDGEADVSAEYDDCKRAAEYSGRPLRDVIREVEAIAREELT